LEKVKKTNVKNAKVFLPGEPSKKDILIEDGIIAIIRDEVRQGIFSGVYELDAEDLFVVPAFTDSGCFALGSKQTGKELPKLQVREFKRFGFFSFVTTLNILDANSRLFDQKEYAKSFDKEGISVRFLTGGLKDKAYHISENIYKDVCEDKLCAGAAVLHNDSFGGIDSRRLLKLCTQVEAAAYDTKSAGVVMLLLGDLALNFDMFMEIAGDGSGREKTVIAWFANRGKALLDSGIEYLRQNGRISLVAGADREKMSEDFIPLSEALIDIYREIRSLDGVLVSSFSGGYLPKRDENTLDQRGEIANLYSEMRIALEKGLPFEEAIKVLAYNPIKIFDLEERKIEVGNFASFLVVDKHLNIKYIVEGESVINPDSFKNPVLFL